MDESGQKKYGLILPKTAKAQLSAPRAGNIFANDDDSDEEEGTDWVKKSLLAANKKNKIKTQTKINIKKALEEDPTVFQYDEVYDNLELAKEEAKLSKVKDKKPKYMIELLKTAERRKKEETHRKERMVQKEREAEGDMFADKESFVTSAYRKQLEEFKQYEEEEEKMKRLEAIGDVTNQKDMSGFYRHIYRQTVERNKDDLGIAIPEIKIAKPREECIPLSIDNDLDKDDPLPSESESGEEDANKIVKCGKSDKVKSVAVSGSARQYRKRHRKSESSESSEDENTTVKSVANENDNSKSLLINQNLEDGSIKKVKLDTENVNKEPESESKNEAFTNADNATKSPKNEDTPNDPANDINNSDIAEKKVEPKKKINIWEKRTVGLVFEAALERYLIRKNMRLRGS